MKISKLALKKESVASGQTISEFFKLHFPAIPVVENNKPIAYITLTHIFRELLPKQVFLHAEAIGKDSGNLEFTHDNFLARFTDMTISHHMIPLLATVEEDDSIVKALSLMLKYDIPLIAVVNKDGDYLGYITYEIIGKYLDSLI